MSGGITRAEHRSATRSASACGTNESVPNGRCGPCCSIDPTGRITGVSATIASRTSGHVISSNCTRDSLRYIWCARPIPDGANRCATVARGRSPVTASEGAP